MIYIGKHDNDTFILYQDGILSLMDRLSLIQYIRETSIDETYIELYDMYRFKNPEFYGDIVITPDNHFVHIPLQNSMVFFDHKSGLFRIFDKLYVLEGTSTSPKVRMVGIQPEDTHALGDRGLYFTIEISGIPYFVGYDNGVYVYGCKALIDSNEALFKAYRKSPNILSIVSDLLPVGVKKRALLEMV